MASPRCQKTRPHHTRTPCQEVPEGPEPWTWPVPNVAFWFEENKVQNCIPKMPKKRAPTTPEHRALQPRADFEKRHFKSAPALKRFQPIDFQISVHFLSNATSKSAPSCSGFSRLTSKWASRHSRVQFMMEKPQHHAQKRLNVFSEIRRKVSKIDMIWKTDSKKEPPPRLEAGQWRAEKPQHRPRTEEKSQRYRT